MIAVIKINLERYYITNKNTYTIKCFQIKFHIRQCPIVTQQFDIKPYINSHLVGNAGFIFI